MKMLFKYYDTRAISAVLLVMALCIIGTGMHDIDNAWNIIHFQDYGGIVDCNSFMCKNAEELYQTGVNYVLGGALLVLAGISILLLWKDGALDEKA